MRVSNLGLDHSAGPGIELMMVHEQPPKANTHHVKLPRQGILQTHSYCPSISLFSVLYTERKLSTSDNLTEIACI